MATVINNSGGSADTGGGWTIGLIALVMVLVVLTLLFGLPNLWAGRESTQITVPDTIDVNIGSAEGETIGQ